jgi:hypothetical protein
VGVLSETQAANSNVNNREKRFVDIPEGRALARVHQHSGRLTQGQDPCGHHELQEGVVISALDGQPDPPPPATIDRDRSSFLFWRSFPARLLGGDIKMRLFLIGIRDPVRPLTALWSW